MKQQSRDINEPSGAEAVRVNLHSLEELRVSLDALTAAYGTDPRNTRARVIAAKDRARYASRNLRASEDKRALKAEMVEWLLVWLDDPAMFSTWVSLKLAVRDREGGATE